MPSHLAQRLTLSGGRDDIGLGLIKVLGGINELLMRWRSHTIHVIAQPAGWYSCHRTPRIAEFSQDKTRVLVRFTAVSWSGETFGGTCLYLNRNGRWGAYVIKPNQSENIATAEAWLGKRKWESW